MKGHGSTPIRNRLLQPLYPERDLQDVPNECRLGATSPLRRLRQGTIQLLIGPDADVCGQGGHYAALFLDFR